MARPRVIARLFTGDLKARLQNVPLHGRYDILCNRERSIRNDEDYQKVIAAVSKEFEEKAVTELGSITLLSEWLDIIIDLGQNPSVVRAPMVKELLSSIVAGLDRHRFDFLPLRIRCGFVMTVTTLFGKNLPNDFIRKCFICVAVGDVRCLSLSDSICTLAATTSYSAHNISSSELQEHIFELVLQLRHDFSILKIDHRIRVLRWMFNSVKFSQSDKGRKALHHIIELIDCNSEARHTLAIDSQGIITAITKECARASIISPSWASDIYTLLNNIHGDIKFLSWNVKDVAVLMRTRVDMKIDTSPVHDQLCDQIIKHVNTFNPTAIEDVANLIMGVKELPSDWILDVLKSKQFRNIFQDVAKGEEGSRGYLHPMNGAAILRRFNPETLKGPIRKACLYSIANAPSADERNVRSLSVFLDISIRYSDVDSASILLKQICRVAKKKLTPKSRVAIRKAHLSVFNSKMPLLIEEAHQLKLHTLAISTSDKPRTGSHVGKRISYSTTVRHKEKEPRESVDKILNEINRQKSTPMRPSRKE